MVMQDNVKKRPSAVLPFFMIWILPLLLTTVSTEAYGQSLKYRVEKLNQLPCCDFSEVPGVIWSGKNPRMRFDELAAYCAPILWYSPDEPLMMGASGKDIRIPEPMPFEENPEPPMVYYRTRTILKEVDAKGEAYIPGQYGRDDSIIDLSNTSGIDLDYFFYYHKEEGLGGHEHDVESATFKITVWQRDDCEDCPFVLIVTRVVGKAHGLKWLDNTLDVDKHAVFPMTLLVEEGKHASCTDKNSDGYYTPGYDVNRRVNDAWGVRDIMRSGALYTGGYQAWMTKVRREEHRVFPPLPADSLLRERYTENGEYAPENAVYTLRPLPQAAYEHQGMARYIGDKGTDPWPKEVPDTDWKSFTRWAETDSFVKSLSIAWRADGDAFGWSFVFPLFIVKNYEDPLAGGYILHRVYYQGKNNALGWMLHYTPSASRWIDSYFSAGIELSAIDLPEGSEPATKVKTNFVFETGIKFRVNLYYTPLKFLTWITDFWGLRIGMKNVGALEIDKLTYVIEIGAGTW
jgi:hypothetical protein